MTEYMEKKIDAFIIKQKVSCKLIPKYNTRALLTKNF